MNLRKLPGKLQLQRVRRVPTKALEERITTMNLQATHTRCRMPKEKPEHTSSSFARSKEYTRQEGRQGIPCRLTVQLRFLKV